VLRMVERDEETVAWAKQKSYLNVQNNNGELILRPSRNANLLTLGVSRSAVQGGEIEFP
jgi:hypothetical protein